MKNEILVPISNGTEEMEAVIIVDILRRADLDVVIAGEYNEITCSRNVKILPDKLINDVCDEQFLAIIIPGGLAGVNNLSKSETLKKIIQNNKNSTIGAICAAPLVLNNMNLLEKNAMLTSHPSVENQFQDYMYSPENVVIDGNLITSRGAGTTFDFAFELVEIFKNETVSQKIKNDILYNY